MTIETFMMAYKDWRCVGVPSYWTSPVNTRQHGVTDTAYIFRCRTKRGRVNSDEDSLVPSSDDDADLGNEDES